VKELPQNGGFSASRPKADNDCQKKRAGTPNQKEIHRSSRRYAIKKAEQLQKRLGVEGTLLPRGKRKGKGKRQHLKRNGTWESQMAERQTVWEEKCTRSAKKGTITFLGHQYMKRES